jgi:hypothetical protein
MNSGYDSKITDITYLLSVASIEDRSRFAGFLKIRIEKRDERFQFFDETGREVGLAEVHQRSQADPEIQRSVYNMWMTYAH